MEPDYKAAAAGADGQTRTFWKGQQDNAQWDALDRAQWRELPARYGPWQSAYARFAKWRDDGTLEKVFRALSADADMQELSLDPTSIKVHESANGGGKN